MAASNTLPEWKQSLIQIALASNILTFGTFTLKSNRKSPYFMNCGLFSKGKAITSLASAYAHTLSSYTSSNPSFSFDLLFGPAYKGIPLCATTAQALITLDSEKFGNVGYSFNRKEAKNHGEGGSLIGEDLKGKKVVIIDDVITAGTAIREAIDIIKAAGGELVGIIVAVDRQEKMPTEAEKRGEGDDGTARGSAIGEVRRETGVPVLAVLTLDDIIGGMEALGRGDEVKAMEDYRRVYGASD